MNTPDPRLPPSSTLCLNPWMPAYFVEFATFEGPRRLRFTLDADRPLGAQVHRILEEMRQHGVVLAGGPGDELAVFWNGAALDVDRSPAVLGVTPDRPLELRMHPRPVRPRTSTPEPPITSFTPPTVYAAPVGGAAGALTAWLAASALTDLGPWLPSYRALDHAVAALLGAGVGAAARALSARRRAGRVWLAAATGFAAGSLGGGVGAMLGTALGDVLDPGYLLGRGIMWAAAAAGAGALLGAVEAGKRRAMDGAAAGIAGGAAGALLLSLPGPAEFWQAMGFAAVGAALGSGLHTPALRRSDAVLSTDGNERGRMEPLRIHEWVLEDGRAVTLPGSGATIRCRAGRCELAPGTGPIRVAGLALDGPRELRNGEVVEVHGMELRFRRRREVLG